MLLGFVFNLVISLNEVTDLTQSIWFLLSLAFMLRLWSMLFVEDKQRDHTWTKTYMICGHTCEMSNPVFECFHEKNEMNDRVLLNNSYS